MVTVSPKQAVKLMEKHAKPTPKTRKAAADPYSGRQHPKEMDAKDEHEPQLLGESNKPLRAANYDNDVKSGWLRGSGENATSKPGFDHSKPKASGGPKNDASGKDCHKSPFSAAHKTY